MATAATQTEPYPQRGKMGPWDCEILSGTVPADASGGLTWSLGWAVVYMAIPIANSSVSTADVGPYNWGYSSGTLTVYGTNAAAANDAGINVLVIGIR